MFMRLLFFVYGVACYAIFLATFLYAIAFVGGCPIVPSRLDGPLEGTLLSAIAIDCALLMVFAVQHSVMARRWFKERWTQIIPWTIERSTYVLFASLALLLLFWQWRPIGGLVWRVEHPVGQAALYGLFAAGWLTVLATTFLINHFHLFGLRQVWLYLVGASYTARNFTTPGPYRLVRHPLYIGSALLGLGFIVAANNAAVAVLTILYLGLTLTAAARSEEAHLDEKFSGAYSDYRAGTMVPADRPYSWKRVVANREYQAVAGLVTAFAFLWWRL